MENGKDIVVFLDTVGRTIIAGKISETEDKLTVKNPAVVNVAPRQEVDPSTGQTVQRMALQLFPLFFREFLAAKEEPVKFVFNKSMITLSEGDISLDFKVMIQYEQLFANIGAVSAPVAPKLEPKTDNVIKLFD